jgi:hypothetical protein
MIHLVESDVKKVLDMSLLDSTPHLLKRMVKSEYEDYYPTPLQSVISRLLVGRVKLEDKEDIRIAWQMCDAGIATGDPSTNEYWIVSPLVREIVYGLLKLFYGMEPLLAT